MATSYRIILIAFTLLSLATIAESQNRYVYDLTIKYYTDTSLICDHPDLNVSQSQNVRALSWVFPDGTPVDSATPLNSNRFILSEARDSVNPAPGAASHYAAYNLTVLRVDDSVFGYYTCVVMYTNNKVSVIRWALNVNGADFTDLIETFEQNAIIGGVAAAAMLVVIAGGCLVWHFRFSNRQSDDEDGQMEEIDGVAAKKGHVYSNKSYSADSDISGVDVHVENGPMEDNKL